MAGVDQPATNGLPSRAADIPPATHAAQQIAEAIKSQPNQPVELILDPEELGKLRMTLHIVDGAITVALAAERGETLDLLRRHIDILAQKLGDAGYQNAGFSFDDNTRNAARQHRPLPPRPGTEPDTPAPATRDLAQPRPAASTGLDLRI
jgi:hypothetical protein